ncbi:zinc finger protein ZFP2-like isoform X2 [Chironomus tepperi]|uniref:zinc finger protein ZFP2-like isoform X2 n=1 Tax=Chironomus tepperi TaxID=113505 RepID=UPI00391F7B94
MSHISSSLARQTEQLKTEDYRAYTKNTSDFSLKNKFLFECLFCKGTFTRILSYLKHISKHEMKQIHKCTICKKIVVDDKHFREHLLDKHREVVELHVEGGGSKQSKSEINNNFAQKTNNSEMDNFYHQLPYSYYQQFPQIATPILSNYIPALPQTSSNNQAIGACKPPQHHSQNQQIHNNPSSNNYMTTKRESSDINQFKCQTCDEILSSSDELNNHTKRHSLDNRFHKRKIHQNEIKKEQNHQKAEQSPTYGESFNQIFECHRCNKQFSRPSSLKQHYLVHKEIKPHRCDVCDLTFSASSQLLLHKISHTNREPYRCQFCDKEFAISDHHKRHLRTHTKEKPFKCDLCGRAFSQSNTLTQHQRIHTGLRPYSCMFCDKKFSVLNYLNNHLRTCKESAKSQILKSNLHANMLK